MSFYCVWNENGQVPKFRHDTIGSAEREAERLATENPGDRFHVLQQVNSCIKNTVTWERPNGDPHNDDVPF